MDIVIVTYIHKNGLGIVFGDRENCIKKYKFIYRR